MFMIKVIWEWEGVLTKSISSINVQIKQEVIYFLLVKNFHIVNVFFSSILSSEVQGWQYSNPLSQNDNGAGVRTNFACQQNSALISYLIGSHISFMSFIKHFISLQIHLRNINLTFKIHFVQPQLQPDKSVSSFSSTYQLFLLGLNTEIIVSNGAVYNRTRACQKGNNKR